MLTFIQRVSPSSIKVDRKIVDEILKGLTILFGAMMDVSIQNDETVTFIIDSKELENG